MLELGLTADNMLWNLCNDAGNKIAIHYHKLQHHAAPVPNLYSQRCAVYYKLKPCFWKAQEACLQ